MSARGFYVRKAQWTAHLESVEDSCLSPGSYFRRLSFAWPAEITHLKSMAGRALGRALPLFGPVYGYW